MTERLLRLARSLLYIAAMTATVVAAADGVKLPDYERVELDNGTILLLNEKHDVPLIGLRAVLRGGAVADERGKGGLASTFAALLEKGAGKRDAAAFAEAVESVGGRLSASAGLEGINISAGFMSRDADLMVELLADMLRHPALDADEMNKLRDRTINFIRAAKDSNLNALLPIYGGAFLFGDHPYGNPVIGSETTLANITHSDMLEYYTNHVGGDRLIIAVSGDFDAGTMRKKLTRAFGGWRSAKSALPVIAAASRQTGRRVLLIDKPGATQTYFWLANVGVAADYSDRAALDIANTVFGGRFTSMLNTELRIKSGLTYGARSSLSRPSLPGSVAITSFTRTGATVEAIDMALGVLGQLRDSGIGEEMVSSAQNYILGQFPTRLETSSQLASQLAVLEAYGLGPAYIDDYGTAILAADVETIAAVIDDVYPSSQDLVFVLLGDASLIRDAVDKYGPVTEMKITEPHFHPAAPN